MQVGLETLEYIESRSDDEVVRLHLQANMALDKIVKKYTWQELIDKGWTHLAYDKIREDGPLTFGKIQEVEAHIDAMRAKRDQAS